MVDAKFWVFSDAYCFVGFLTQILFILTPIAFAIQLKYGVLKIERVSIIGLLSLFCNAFIYFFTSIYKRKEGEEIDPLDFANLAGTYLGFIYLIVYIYFIHFKINKKLGLLYMGILTISSVAVWLIILFTIEKDNVADKIFSWLGIIFNVTEYLPMGFDIVYLIKHKISEKYLLFGAFFGFLNCVAWLAWAINAVAVNHDNLEHSIVANCLGICLQICQFTLFFIFRKNTDDDINIDETEEKKNDIIDSTNNELDNAETKDPDYMKDYI
jgi:hypothetical protein